MTSESDSKAGRRPPTIELTATEVGKGAESRASGGDDPASERATIHEPADEANAAESTQAGISAAGSDAAEPQQPGHSRGRVTSHILSALFGAIATAAIIGGVWLGGLIPPRNPAAQSDAVSPTSPSAAGTATTTRQFDADVTARLDKIERAIQGERAEPALGNRLAAVEAQEKSLGNSVATLSGRIDEIASTSQSAVKQADAAHAAAEAATSASQATGHAVSQNAVQRSDIEALANRVVALESTVKALAAAATQPAAQTDDRPARLSIAAEALRAAVERGAPYQAELAAVQALGADPSATTPLEPFAKTGVASAGALARELGAIASTLQDGAEPAATDATFLGRLKANAQKLVRITPVDAPAGSDTKDVVDRIKFDAAHGDIAAAIADIGQSPDSTKALAVDWTKKAEARGAAIAASRQIAADALAALSKPSGQ